MIATSRKSASRPAVSREYEFSRLQNETLASAHEALIPVVSQRRGSGPRRPDEGEVLTTVYRAPRSVAGA